MVLVTNGFAFIHRAPSPQTVLTRPSVYKDTHSSNGDKSLFFLFAPFFSKLKGAISNFHHGQIWDNKKLPCEAVELLFHLSVLLIVSPFFIYLFTTSGWLHVHFLSTTVALPLL